MDLYRHPKRLFIGFLLLSLLLHLLLLLIPKASLLPRPDLPEPVYVEVRPESEQEMSRELDLPVREELEKPRETPAERLGPADQVVEEEVAPLARDDMDQPAPQQATKPVPPAVPQPEIEAQPEPQEDVARQEAVEEKPARQDVPPQETAEPTERPATEDGTRPPITTSPPARPLPDMESLTTISPQVLARIESDWRQKYRAEVEHGDTVWLNTEQDLLNSFMRRFRTNVYLVWNYPARALEQNQQGTCLLRITVNRHGDVEDVQLLETTGYPLLDREAIDSVRKGATYGPLPRAYPHDTLKIMAFFQYSISNVIQYNRRPGRIY